MLQHLGNSALNTLLDIFNLSWRQGQVPQCWKEAIMIPILKKGKRKSKASSFRLMSLTSSCCKLLERIINKRIKPLFNTPQQQDIYHQLTRSEQTTIFRLRTGHNRLNQNLHKVMKVVPSPMCPCGEAEQDTAHLLQSCKINQALRDKIWHSETPLKEKLFGPVDALQKTTRFVEETSLQV
ncbi:unnamed protein product [Mytilus coruscus]|uniref:Reverse transcriptase zinc-binding domain-containing protein n=1 Tax=Mytilus coruscus TaxID=42192 RepID=A0A6J8EEP1_MYTCO|nr:unnamed protein product [Mytilus coruscus]